MSETTSSTTLPLFAVFDPSDTTGFLLADQLRTLPAHVEVVHSLVGLLAAAARVDLLLVPTRPVGATLPGVLAEFRAVADPRTGVVVYTDMGSDTVRVAALDAGADYVLTQPVTHAELHAVTRMLLRRADLIAFAHAAAGPARTRAGRHAGDPEVVGDQAPAAAMSADAFTAPDVFAVPDPRGASEQASAAPWLPAGAPAEQQLTDAEPMAAPAAALIADVPAASDVHAAAGPAVPVDPPAGLLPAGAIVLDQAGLAALISAAVTAAVEAGVRAGRQG